MVLQTQLDPLQVADWDSSLSSIIDEMNGEPLNVHKLMANNPALLKAWWNFRNYSITGGALGTRLGELVILRVAVHMRAWYEWASHVERSIARGLSMDEIERVRKVAPQGVFQESWEESEALLLAAVDELIARQRLSPASLQKLKMHYDNQQLIDLMAIHGMYIILGCMINTWGLELDTSVQAKLPAMVNQQQFEAELF
jgi:alkylhydroperoxidase/carboxymuconolactone decarboxylase family protein YurZ